MTANQKTTQTSHRKNHGRRKHEMSYTRISMTLVRKMRELTKPQMIVRVDSMTTILITKWTLLAK